MPLKNIQTKFDTILSERNNLCEEKSSLEKNLTKANQEVLTQQKTELENRINQEENYLNTLALDGAARQETINNQNTKISLIKKSLEDTKELLSKVGKEDFRGQLEIYLSNKITILKERNEMWEEITKKNNRLFQLEKLFVGTARILNERCESINHLKEQLKKEKEEKGISQEQAEHLQEDIQHLEEQKQELSKRIKELENLDEEIRKLRDQELAELRKENAELATNLQEVQNQITTLTAERNNRPNITLDKWNDYRKRPTHQELTQINNQLTSVRQELDKEKGWCDKWIKDTRTHITSGMDDSKELPTFIANKLGSTSKVYFEVGFSFGAKKDELYITYIRDVEEGKKIIKAISEYYKQKSEDRQQWRRRR